MLAPTAGVALVILAPLAWAARSLSLSTKPGVVIATEARLTDASGAPVAGDGVPEGASVEVGEARGAQVHVRWGATEGWVAGSEVRVLGAR